MDWQERAERAERTIETAIRVLERDEDVTAIGACIRTAHVLREGGTVATGPKDEELLRFALAESVKLQAHYAELLNMHDGGARLIFPTVESWLERLSRLTE